MLSPVIKPNQLGKYVLHLCNIRKLNLDVDIISNYLSKNINSKKDYYEDYKQVLKINDYQFIEWVVSKSCNGTILGNKCKTMNILSKDNYALDTSCLSVSKTGIKTGEKCIVQITNNYDLQQLDTLFQSENTTQILSLFKNRIIDKYSEFSYQYDIDIHKLYYCIFISDYTNIYMLLFRLNLDYLSLVSPNKISKKKKSISLHNMIEPKLGSVEIVSKKKIMELRLNYNVIHNKKVVNIL